MRTVWFVWEAPASERVTFDTAGSSFDTVLAVHTGDMYEQSLQLVSNDDASPELGIRTSAVIFNAMAGEPYHIGVGGHCYDGGEITLNWGPAPTATATPTETPPFTASPTASPTNTPVPPTATSTPVVKCVGDCGGVHKVVVTNIITLVNIVLGTAQCSTACPQGVDCSKPVTVGTIIMAVNNALSECPCVRAQSCV